MLLKPESVEACLEVHLDRRNHWLFTWLPARCVVKTQGDHMSDMPCQAYGTVTDMLSFQAQAAGI